MKNTIGSLATLLFLLSCSSSTPTKSNTSTENLLPKALSAYNSVPTLNDLLIESTQQDGRACVDKSDIDGFATHNSRVMSISGRAGEHFVAYLAPRCNSLNTAFNLSFESRNKDVCGGVFDRVRTTEEWCQIKALYSFESREQALNTLRDLSAKRISIKRYLKANKKKIVND